MSTLIVAVGLPQAGKSSWARLQGLPIVNPDSVRLAIHGEVFNLKAEPWVWEVSYAMAEALFRAGHEKVIVDATNVTMKRRVEWPRRLGNLAGVELKIFDTLPKVCIERARKNNREDLVPVIERMAKDWDLQRPPGWEDR